MATEAEIATLRLNIGDGRPPGEDDDPLDGSTTFYADVELSAYLDAYSGSEPRARVAALIPMVADAAKANEFTEGDYSEKVRLFEHLSAMLEAARAEVAALDDQDAALARGKARYPTRVNVQYVF